MGDLITFLLLVGCGYFIGTQVEKKHYSSIVAREQVYRELPVVSGKNFLEDRPVAASRLAYGSVVVSTDFFKALLSGLRNLLGGEVSASESLLDRARREAVLRLKESVPDADIILNLKLETTQIGLANGACVEAIAYGTAVYYAK